MTLKIKFHRSLKKSDFIISGVVSFEIHEDYIHVDYLKFDEDCNCELVHFHRFVTSEIRYISLKDGFYRYSIQVS